ncbi:MAG: YidC/Oxa1 family membrane protein insertase [Candidatus Paceibacterota bacterium]|jgi:YidC/Oxa1 family membrane protein insertase
MLLNLWDVALYKPLLNALAFLVSVIPGGDIGIAIVILTILVKTILFPFSQKTLESQAKIKKIEPELKKIKESGKSKEEQARLTMELYKEKKVNPFSGCFLTLIQLPIIFALYFVFYKGIDFSQASLYSFIAIPEFINTEFLGLLDVAGKNIILAILAGISQFLQAQFMPKPAVSDSSSSPDKKPSFQESLTKSMSTQMKYVFPLIVVFIAYRISGAVALYWITSNIFTIGQQIYARRKKDTK